jgi:transposase-like protein
MKNVDTITKERTESSAPTKRTKRRHSAEFKARVVEACEERGASVAGVALANGVNANLVRKWIDKKQREAAPDIAASLLPVRIVPGAAQSAMRPMRGLTGVHGHAIEVELGGAVIRLRTDFDTAALRDVVRVLRDSLLR